MGKEILGEYIDITRTLLSALQEIDSNVLPAVVGEIDGLTANANASQPAKQQVAALKQQFAKAANEAMRGVIDYNISVNALVAALDTSRELAANLLALTDGAGDKKISALADSDADGNFGEEFLDKYYDSIVDYNYIVEQLYKNGFIKEVFDSVDFIEDGKPFDKAALKRELMDYLYEWLEEELRIHGDLQSYLNTGNVYRTLKGDDWDDFCEAVINRGQEIIDDIKSSNKVKSYFEKEADEYLNKIEAERK